MKADAAAGRGIDDHAICRVRPDGADIGSRVPIWRAIYQYLEVPSTIYTELLAAESKGQYFNSEIRDAYGFVRVDWGGRSATAR